MAQYKHFRLPTPGSLSVRRYICVSTCWILNSFRHQCSWFVFFCILRNLNGAAALQPRCIPVLDNINIPGWNGCRDNVRRNVRNVELKMKSGIISVKERVRKKEQRLIVLTTKKGLEVTLNCHSKLLSGNSLGGFGCCQSRHKPEHNGNTLTTVSPSTSTHPRCTLPSSPCCLQRLLLCLWSCHQSPQKNTPLHSSSTRVYRQVCFSVAKENDERIFSCLIIGKDNSEHCGQMHSIRGWWWGVGGEQRQLQDDSRFV